MRQGWLDHLMMSCNGKGHSSFAGVKFQVHLIGGKAAACLPETLSFPGFESSGNLLPKSKKDMLQVHSYCFLSDV